jgi:hypothetical protein
MKTLRRQLQILSLEDSDDGNTQPSSQYNTPVAKPSSLAPDLNLEKSGGADMQMAATRLLSLSKLPTNLQNLEADLENVIINDPPKEVAPNSSMENKIPLADPEALMVATVVSLQG